MATPFDQLKSNFGKNDIVIVSGGAWNSIIDGMKKLWRGDNVNAKGTTTKDSGGMSGWTIFGVSTNTAQAASSVTTYNPYQIISAFPTSPGAESYNVTFQPGIINGNIFPKIGTNFMWVLVPTTTGGVTTYAYPTVTVNWGDTVYLKGTVTAGVLTDVSINSGATPTTETDSVTTYIIATCDLHTGALIQISKGNLSYVAAAAYFNSGSRLIYHLWTIVDNII